LSYLVAKSLNSRPAGERLRGLLSDSGILRIPGAYNGLAALQAKRAGFEALYLSGAAMSASMGLPDLGVLGKEEVCFFIRQICRAADLPVVVDGDTGFGGVLNAMDMVRSFEEAGAAAVHIEDQELPKKCGHLNDKKLISSEEMAAKISAASRARKHLCIIARTDAAASEGFDAAVHRAKLYLEAGADAIFPEALTSQEMFRDLAKQVKAPLLANMTEFGRTPYLSAADFEALGYKMVIWPVSALRIAAKAQEGFYSKLRARDRADGMLDAMQTRAELYDLIGYADYEALDNSLKKTVVTDAMRGLRAKAN
jgi:methylisocitrate lyase